MIEVLKRVIANILNALYEPFFSAAIFSVLFMSVYMFAKQFGWKYIIRSWIESFRDFKRFRVIFFWMFYISLILFRTLLNRTMWINPLTNVIGIWGIYNEKGELTTEILENLALFIPYTVLLLCSFHEKILGEKRKLFFVLWRSTKHVFFFSLLIECLQLFFRRGTFQLSDMFYNTIGGLVGGLIYWFGYRITNIKNKKYCNNLFL